MDNLVFHIIYTLLVVSNAYGSYNCVCNYRVETAVYKEADIHSEVLGYMYEFDCKPQSSIYRPGWEVIEFEHQIAYVAGDDQIQVQICTGDVPPADRRTTPRVAITELMQSTNTISVTPNKLNITHAIPITTSNSSFNTTFPITFNSNSSTFSTNIHLYNTTRNNSYTTVTVTGTLTSSNSTILNALTTPYSTHISNGTRIPVFTSPRTSMIPFNHSDTLPNISVRTTPNPSFSSNIYGTTTLNYIQNVTQTATQQFNNNNTASNTLSILAVLTNATQSTLSKITETSQSMTLKATNATQATVSKTINASQSTPSKTINASQSTPSKTTNATLSTPSKTTNASQSTSSKTINATQSTPSTTTNATQSTSLETINATQSTPSKTTNATTPQTKPINATIVTKHASTNSPTTSTLSSNNSSSTTMSTVNVLPTNVTTVIDNTTRLGLDTHKTNVHNITTLSSTLSSTTTTARTIYTTTTSQVMDRVDLCPYQFLANDYNNKNYPHFRQYGEFCFELREREGSNTWSEARDDCVARGGELVVINDIEVEKRVNNLTTSMHYQDGVWIGLRVATTQNDRYVWVDGSVPASSTLTNHDLYDPGSTSGRDCVVTMVTTRAWRNAACETENHHWVCQYSIY